MLTEVAEAAPVGQIAVMPTPSSGPWIDGKEPSAGSSAPLGKGLHLAQHSARTGLATSWLVVGGPAVWTLPEALTPSVLDRFAAGERDVVARVLLAAHPDQPAAYVTHAGGLWLLVREGTEVAVEELTPPTVVDDGSKKGKKKKKKGK